MFWRKKWPFGLVLCLMVNLSVFSQVKDEAALKKEAANAFEEEDYARGYKLYSTLVSNYPKDPEYNYRLGVCAMFAEGDKKKPINYLQLAAKNEKEVEKEVFFYLGKAFHLNFRFDEAIKFYSQFKQVGSGSMQKKLQVDREIQCCKNAKRLLSNVQELVVLEKKQVARSDYYRSYDLKDIGGKLLVKPAEFTTGADKKKKDNSIIFMPASKDFLYYASYGEKGDNKDIYLVRRMPNGNWGKPESLGNTINTEYDEDYPFLHPTGRTLYFASKGHNSMGGYDIFKAELDEGTGKWKTPVNLDFPINTPSDDYLFVTDSLEKIAYLASTRQSPAGKTDIYKILTERRPAEYAYLRGDVLKKADNQSVLSKIKVKNIDTGEDEGSFAADANGEYSIRLSNGGKFIFTVETPGFPTQSQGVNIPVAYSYKPYRQTIEYDNQKLVITNFFETNDKDENNYLQYIKLIEEKAKMDVNSGDFDLTSANPLANNNSNNQQIKPDTSSTAANNTTAANTNTTTTNANTPKNNVSNKQLIDIAYSDAKDLQKEADDLKQDAKTAFSAANSKQDYANEKKQEYTEALNKANSENNPDKKQELLNQSDKIKDEADLAALQSKTANTIAQQLEVDANNKQKEADLNLQYAKALEEADKTKNNKQAIAKLEDLQKQMEDLSKQKSQSNALVESIKADASNKEKELKNAETKQQRLDKEESEMKKQVDEIDSQIAKTKDKGMLENLNAQKEELTGDLNEKKKESELNKNKINTLKEESEALNSQADFAANIAAGNVPANAGTNTTNTNTVAATNTVVATNTVATNTTTTSNTVVTTNTTATTNTAVSTNTTTVATNNPPAFEDKAAKYDNDLASLNNAGNTLDNNKKKSDVLKQYILTVDSAIKDKKQELAKAKTATDKTALNKEIKALTDKKSGLQKESNLVVAQVKEQEKQAAIAANNTKTDSLKTVATNSATPAITKVDTSQTKIITDNQDPRIQNVNSLIAVSQNNFNEEKKLMGNMEYSDPKALQLKKQADDKMSELYKNNSLVEQQLQQLKTKMASENAANNDKKIEELNKQGDDLSNQAFQLRKEAKNKTGAEKQNALVKIMELEKNASGVKYQAAKLQYQSDDNNFETNKQAINQLLASGGDSPEVQQAKELESQSEKIKKEALSLREEAEAQSEVEAKIGGLGNADEKEKEALKKQEEALALLKKANPQTNMTASSSDKQLEEIKTKLDKENLASVSALKILADANKAEYNAQLAAVNKAEKAGGSNKEEALTEKNIAIAGFKQANDDLIKVNSIKDDKQKREAMLAANYKLEESIIQLKNVQKILSGESIASNNTTSTNTVTTIETNTTSTTNTVAVNNNTVETNTVIVNNVTTNTVASTETVAVNNNTVTTNTVANTETVAINNNTPTTNTTAVAGNQSLTPQKTEEVKKSAEYLKYTTLQNDANKYTELANKDAALAKEYQVKYEKLKQETDSMPPVEAKVKKEAEANAYKQKADSLNDIARNTQSFADSKKQEADAYLQGLDQNTSANITAVAAKDKTTGTTKYSDYSPTFKESANSKDSQLAGLKANGNDSKNLQEQNNVITAYIKDIDTEVAALKKQQAAAATQEEKNKIAQQVKNLQTRKLELSNEKSTNENSIRIASTNTVNNNSTANNTTTTNTVAAANNTGNNTAATNTTTNTNITGSGFEVRNTNAYSNANPIPVNEKLPDGLVFRVQIGAFKNPIDPSRFAGLAPIGAESTNFGFIRYQVGMFTDFQKANAVKNDLRKLRYNDAFVVVYRNGKRISLAEALDSLGKTGADISANANSSAGINTNSNIPVNPEAGNTNVFPVNSSGDLNTFNGAFYTVQIGVYSNNVTAAGLLNLSPIFKEALPTGYYRYTAGMYNSFDKVQSDRARVVSMGIKDAFVGGYLNGKRISVNEPVADATAQFLIDKPIIFPAEGAVNNNTAPANNIPVNNQPANNVQPVSNGITEGPAPTPENGVKVGEDGITFKVQIGAYSKQVPVEVVNNWLKIKTWPIRNVLVNGLYIYTVGSFTENKFAKALRDEVKSLGMSDAYVVVYKDGKKLYGAEAAQYLNR